MDNQLLQAIMAQAQQPQTKTIVEFRGGILTQKGTTVTADERKGKVALVMGEDGMLHLQWTLRPSGNMVTDLILFPKSATWQLLPECSDGRVYLLQFKSSPSNRRFFWMQEPLDDKDEEIAKKINDTIDSPPVQENSLAGLMGGDFDQSRIQSMLGAGARPATSPAAIPTSSSSATPAAAAATATPATPAAAPAAATPAAAAAAAAPAAAAGSEAAQSEAALAASWNSLAAQMQQQTQTTLPEVLDSSRVEAALTDEMIERLMEHLPETQQTPHDARQTLRSPQFQQTAQRLSSILNSSQFPALMASLSLPHTGSIGVEAFLAAIEEEAKKDDSPK